MTQIDKKGWKKVRFGDVCRNLNVTIKNPSEQGYNRVVGLENIESGNLHISSWGDVSDGTTFTKTFEPGHVLFGKRRAYLKKAAYTEFKGLCSGDILVFEANQKVINTELLPFIVSSDRFFEHAVKTSAGSLSPRTKFADLKGFEFYLPGQELQEKYFKLFHAHLDLIESYNRLMSEFSLAKKNITHRFITLWQNTEVSLKELNKVRFRAISTKQFNSEEFLHYSLPSFDQGVNPVVNHPYFQQC